jgi:hypothetical protein
MLNNPPEHKFLLSAFPHRFREKEEDVIEELKSGVIDSLDRRDQTQEEIYRSYRSDSTSLTPHARINGTTAINHTGSLFFHHHVTFR